jgi:hypothetical protein
VAFKQWGFCGDLQFIWKAKKNDKKYDLGHCFYLFGFPMFVMSLRTLETEKHSEKLLLSAR